LPPSSNSSAYSLFRIIGLENGGREIVRPTAWPGRNDPDRAEAQ
jgi:hypothetical protein